MKRFHGVLHQPAEPIKGRLPRRKGGRCLLQCLQLAKRDAQGGAGKALVRDRNRGRFATGGDGINDPPLECHEIGIAITFEEGLEGDVAIVPERARSAKR